MGTKNHSLAKKVVKSTLAISLLVALTGCGKQTSEDFVSDAKQFLTAQDVRSAVLSYKNAIQLEPDNAQLRFDLGNIYIDAKEYEGAEKELQRALDLGYDASKVIPLLAKAYQHTDANVALEQLATSNVSLSPVEAAQVGFYKLQALAELGKPAEALALQTELSQLQTSSVYKGLIDTYPFLINNELDEAIEATKLLVEQAPQNQDVLLQMGNLYMRKQAFADAIDTYTNYATIYPEDRQVVLGLTTLLLNQNRAPEAEKYIDELLEIAPENALLNAYKGVVLSSQGEHEKAIEKLSFATANGYTESLAYLVSGFSYYSLQQYDKAATNLLIVAEQLPESHPGLRMLADSLLKQGKGEEASDILAQIDGGFDNDASLFSSAGYQLLRAGDVETAKEMIAKSGRVSTSAEELTRLGVLQLGVNDVDGLINLEEAIKIAPDSLGARQSLARGYLSTGQYDKAMELADKWIANDDQDTNAYILKAQAAIAKGEIEQAETYIQQARELSPDSAAVIVNQASIAMAQEQYDQAGELVDAALKQDPTNVTAHVVNFAVEQFKGDASVALNEALTALNNASDDMQLRTTVAQMQLLAQQPEAALATLSPVEASIRAPMVYWTIKARGLVSTNDVDALKDHYNTWHKLYPNSRDAKLGKLFVYDSLGQYEDGLLMLDNIDIAETDTQLRLLKAYYLVRTRKGRQADAILNSMSEEELALPLANNVRAQSLLLRNKPAEALAFAKTAYEQSQNPTNLMLLVASMDGSGDRAGSESFLADVVAQSPSDAVSRILYAERVLSSDPDKAIKTYEEVLALRPNHMISQNNLAYLYKQKGELDKALPLALKVAEASPNSPDTLDTLAQVYIARGEMDKAIEIYNRVANMTIRNEEVYVNYVELLLKTGQTKVAERRLSERLFETEAAKARIAKLKAQYNI